MIKNKLIIRAKSFNRHVSKIQKTAALSEINEKKNRR